MPNWCDNTLYIESDKETIAHIVEAIEQGKLLHFMNPMPEDKAEDWYSWRVDNWGTKWEVEAHIDSEHDETSVSIWFDSAWAPPTAAYDSFYNRMNELNRPIEIRAQYIEWGGQFCGEYINGEDQCWIIPDNVEEAKGNIPEEILEHFNILETLECCAENEDKPEKEKEVDHADDV